MASYAARRMVGREGFEPPKSETSGLQPDPFDRFGTDPRLINNELNGILT